ncbi:hypothetical protein [Streptomyces sp. NPDC059489]
MLQAAADAAGQPIEVLEAVNVVVPDGLLIPDIVGADAVSPSPTRTLPPA